MTFTSETSFWGRLTVGQKLAVIPGLFILAIAGILLYTLLTIQDQKLDNEAVFIASRQRMLNQRHALQVLMVSQGLGADLPATRELTNKVLLDSLKNLDYRATRKVLNDTAESLHHGGPSINLLTGEIKQVPPAPTAEIAAAIVEQKQALADVSAKADQFLKLKPGDPTYQAEFLELMDLVNAAEVKVHVAGRMLVASSQAKIATMVQRETIICSVVALLGITFSWLVSKAIVGPLAQVVDRAQSIAQGDLRGEKLPVTSGDEIGRLATVFNQMIDSLKDLAGQTVAVTANVNSAAAEILASTQQQAASTRQQAATVQQITTTMEEVRQAGAQISDKAKNVATAAEATSTTTQSGLASVQEANRTMEAIRDQVEEVAEKIVALSEKTQAVGEIIATVNDIAERSNLLALNAAIEAAGAGEQGNRFSVVANEIKNLADQAKESTVQVRTILGDIQKGINSSVMLTEEAVKRADTGKQQADITEQTIRRMADTMQESVQTFQQIIGATSQQQIGFEQVTQGMQDIRQAATQTAAGTLQLEKAVADLNAQSHQLREAVGRYQI